MKPFRHWSLGTRLALVAGVTTREGLACAFVFSRLVHVWNRLATVTYLFRTYQAARSRLEVAPAHHLPPPPGARV